MRLRNWLVRASIPVAALRHQSLAFWRRDRASRSFMRPRCRAWDDGSMRRPVVVVVVVFESYCRRALPIQTPVTSRVKTSLLAGV